MNETGPNKAIIAIIVIVLLAAAGGGGYYLLNANKNSASKQSNSETTQTASDDTSTIASDATYKDGTYEATGSYASPGGTQKVKVSINLLDGKVEDSNVDSEANDPTAAQYQAAFIGGYKSLITGKPINDVKLSVVAGSSLTSTGFNRAIEQIKKDAAA